MKTIMKTILTFLVVIIPVLANAQFDKPYPDETGKYPDVLNYKVLTDQEPFYPQGEDAFFNYFLENMVYSEEAKAKNISGNVMVSFDVMPDSSITAISVLKGVGYGVDEEVIRLLSPLKYAPGVQNGERVRMNVIMTVFVVSH